MRKLFSMTAFVTISIVLVTGNVFARGTSDPQIQERIEKQQKRIDNGIKSGELTPEEAKILQDNLEWIKDREEEFKEDGNLTHTEKEELRQMLDNNNEMIFNKKRNAVRSIRKSPKPHEMSKAEEMPIRERIMRQQKKIDHGVFSGALTLEEAKILQDNLDQIKTEEEKLRAEGKLTSTERARLEEKLNVNGKMIREKKHNPVKRF